jgi:protein SCO1/2
MGVGAEGAYEDARQADTRAERASVVALGVVLAVTAVWFALALWPTGDAAPEWLARAREVCFRPGTDGLPDTGGWLALTGPPLSLLGVLMFGWGGDLRRGLAGLRGRSGGRGLLAVGTLLIVAGIGAVGVRVAAASAWISPDPVPSAPPSAVAQPRLDLAAPPLQLVDQNGEVTTLDRFRGRSVLVTFAFGHCQTVCPTVVRDVAEARRRLEVEGIEAVALVVTMDPWRDTPARLGHLARQWELEDASFVLGGEVETVEQTLDAWEVSRVRDERTGDFLHTRVVYLIAPDGRIAFATGGGTDELVDLARRI